MIPACPLNVASVTSDSLNFGRSASVVVKLAKCEHLQARMYSAVNDSPPWRFSASSCSFACAGLMATKVVSRYKSTSWNSGTAVLPYLSSNSSRYELARSLAGGLRCCNNRSVPTSLVSDLALTILAIAWTSSWSRVKFSHWLLS